MAEVSLVIDLEKAVWREEDHPRDNRGRFTKKHGGNTATTTKDDNKKKTAKKATSKASKAKKTGETKAKKETKKADSKTTKAKKTTKTKKTTKAKETVKVASTKAKETKTTKTQKKADATKNAAAVKDPTKAKKETSKKKASKTTKTATTKAKETKTTKTQKKADATKKATAVKDPTKRVRQVKGKSPQRVQAARVKAMKEKAKKETKAIQEAKEKWALEAPDIKRVAIPKSTSEAKKTSAALEDAKQGWKEFEKPSVQHTIDSMWDTSEVRAILAKPPSKRDLKDIQRIAGEITQKNDKLARHVVLNRGRALGLNLAAHVYRMGEGRDAKIQETGIYADMLQTARGAMFETLYNVLQGAENPGQRTTIGAHVVNRMKHKLQKEMYKFLNEIPIPERVRKANAEMIQAENELAHQLGRKPTDEELGKYLMKHSEAFRTSPIKKPPYWDEKEQRWVATKEDEKNPAERVKQLRAYAAQQRTVSANVNIGDEGEREIDIQSNIADEHQDSPDEIYEKKERQRELKTQLPKAMKEMGLSNTSIQLLAIKFSQPSEVRNQPFLTNKEIADRYNKMFGTNYSDKWVHKWVTAGMKKIAEARANKHPAIEQLRLFKSFVFNLILKSMYEMDLVKSLHDWGLDATVLRPKFTRIQTGYSLFDVKKSLAPHEYIGSYVLTDEGYVSARIIEHALPEYDELVKAFQDFEALEKALFPHKGASNAGINARASEYARKNKDKITSMATTQRERLLQKEGPLTWSEQLVVDNPGAAWITWGGKKILIKGDGTILYDSANSAHREQIAERFGITDQADKLDYHHEEEQLRELRERREQEAREAWEKEGKFKKTERAQDIFLKRYGARLNRETGELEFLHDDEADRHAIDVGVQAFNETMAELKTKLDDVRRGGLDTYAHRTTEVYYRMDDDARKAYDEATEEERARMLGQYFLEQEGVRDVMEKAKAMAKKAKRNDGKNIQKELAEELKELGNTHGSMALRNADKMSALFNKMITGEVKTDEDLMRELGERELSRAREEANKKMLPEGYYEIGNPSNGKAMVVYIGHRRDEIKNTYQSYVKEAFDPETGEHFATEDVQASWGRLGKELGLKAASAEAFIYGAHKNATSPVIRQMTEDEAKELRKQTRLGLQDDMLHKNFRLIDHDAKTGRKTFAQEMPDGTQNVIEVDGTGRIIDPIMARLIQQKKDIHTVEDLHDVLKQAVGNRAWVTAHVGSDIHIGDAVGHHLEIMYDGKGAPLVVSGAYKGYRYVDSRDVPKGAIDPATGEPIKALFHNGRLVDRKITDMNKIPIEKGNPVMYKDGNTWKRGRVRDVRDGNYQVVDSKGNVVGMFKRNELRQATTKGRTLAQSGTAVLKLADVGTHRINTDEAFKGAPVKAKRLFEEALKKANVKNTHDNEGNLKRELALNDEEMNRLRRILGRSKAGRAMLKQFRTSHMSELELHVPEHLRETVEGEGVQLNKDGIARISTAKFEELRNVLSREGSGISLHHRAHEHLMEYFRSKDRTPPTREYLEQNYQPAKVSTKRGEFDSIYRGLFKDDSFLADPNAGMYKTQLEGVHHLVSRKRGIAGHGMGTGKTILGVVAAAHYKAKMLAQGQKPKKTLVVAPKGIMSDWGKEVFDHTNMKALYIGSNLKGQKKHETSGRSLWGQEGKEHEAITFARLNKELKNHQEGSENFDHDFHIMSYETFSRNKDKLVNSGLYDNIIIDEIHAFKNQGGKRGRSLAEATDKFKNVWGLSGTPMENDAREIWSLIDTISGGRHELGSQKEFTDKYMMKDRKGKIVGIKPGKPAEELGDILANFVQFRAGEDVEYNDGSKIEFPHLAGSEGDANFQNDFVGNLVDRSRDHKTNAYYGTKHSVVDFDEQEITARTPSGDTYTVRAFKPKNLSPAMQALYDEYSKLQEKYLPPSKLQELVTATATGMDQKGKKGQSYLEAMTKLQKFLNAPLSAKIYVPGAQSAIDAKETDAQSETADTKGKKNKSEPIPYVLDEYGNKRYYESDGKGGYLKNEDGSPKLLPPLHHNNPKADYLKQRLTKYLDELARENAARRAAGKPELMPKVVVKSSFTTFGTDIVHGVLNDLEHPVTGHPEVLRWKAMVGDRFGHGQFTGQSEDRESVKTGFRGDKKNYAENQGYLWATTVSPAGKEGVDFGNAHYMIHYDQDWNPQKMAQFTARVRRSDSWVKGHKAVGRANAVRVESLHMPGTIEDFYFDSQDVKMENIERLTQATKEREKQVKYGDTASGYGQTGRGFTRGGKRRVQARRPRRAEGVAKLPQRPRENAGRGGVAQRAVAKSVKLVVLL